MTRIEDSPDPNIDASAETNPSGKRSVRPIAALVTCGFVIFVLAFGLRFVHIGDSSFWQDEILQLQRTTLSLAEVWTYAPRNKPPLDYFVQALIIGDHPAEWQARLHACLFGAAFVVVFTYWGWRTGGFALGAIAFFVSVASPILVRFSQEGRPYALMLLAEAVFFCVLFAPRRGGERDRRWWILFFCATGFCIWSHYSLFLPCIAAALPAFFLRDPNPGPSSIQEGNTGRMAGAPTPRLFITCIGFLMLAISPLMGRGREAFRGQFNWAVSDRTESAFRLENTRNYMDVLAWGTDIDDALRFGGLVFAMLMLIGFLSSVRRNRRMAWGCAVAFVAAYAGTLILYALLDRWIKVRYVLGAYPPALFLAALGIHAIGLKLGELIRSDTAKKAGGVIAVGIAGCVGLAQANHVLNHPVQRDDWRSVVERVETNREESTALLVADWHSLGVLGYYLELADLHTPVRGLFYDPEAMDSRPDSERDTWVFTTHEDWWNIDREEISIFLSEYVLMPQEIPGVWGVEIRRNRSMEGVAEDRGLPLIHTAGGETLKLELSLEGDGSEHLGGGWFTSHEWAAPFYQQKLMGRNAEILVPLAVPRSIEIRARLRQRGEPDHPPLQVSIELRDQPIERWRIGPEWETYSLTIVPEETLANLNVISFEASEALRIPAPEEGVGPGVSIEVEWLEMTIGAPTVGDDDPTLAMAGETERPGL